LNMAFESFSLHTRERFCFLNITQKVQDVVSRLGVSDGVCTIFVPHTTAGITINEAADPNVIRDIQMLLRKLVPERENYRHAEGNSDAHVCASLIGSSVSIPISRSRLAFGTWQGIFFCEFDGPRNRSVHVQVLG
jgi:secondary thiamine-phosphate synthase enzyme